MTLRVRLDPLLALTVLSLFACGNPPGPSQQDAALGVDSGTPDAGHDAGTLDAGTDAGTDAGHDAGTDAGTDAGVACDGDQLVSSAGCGAGGKCSLQFSATGDIAVGCCQAGSVGEGGGCNPLASQSRDHAGYVCDDCAPGLVCVDFTCRYYCDARTMECPPNETCHPAAGIPSAPNYGHCE